MPKDDAPTTPTTLAGGKQTAKSSADIARATSQEIEQKQAKGKDSRVRVVAIRVGYNGIKRMKEGARFPVAANSDEFVTADEAAKAGRWKDREGVRKSATWQQREDVYDAQQAAAQEAAELEGVEG